MEIDDEEIEVTTSTSSKGEKKRFEVKKVRKFNKGIRPCISASFWLRFLIIIFFVLFY